MKKILTLICFMLGFWPSLIYARGGGGCIERGSLILTPTGNIPVEKLKVGDKVISLSGSSLVESRVEVSYAVKPEEYVELALEDRAIRLTSEHPVEISPGVFRMAGCLKRGDKIYILENNSIRNVFINSIKHVPAAKAAYNLLVSPYGTYFANGIIVHNKGCFLPDTLIRKEDGSESPISNICPNDRLVAFTADGKLVSATVQKVLTHDVNEYCVVTTAKNIVHVTLEHPFYVGNGTFKTLEALKVGDSIFAFDGKGLSQQKIESIKTIKAKTRVYNLQTDKPNTFFANGIAVHNKGGGCFLPDTLIRKEDGSELPISNIRLNDRLLAFTADGKLVSAAVQKVLTRDVNEYCIVKTAKNIVHVTAEHPFYVGNGTFKTLEALKVGDNIFAFDGKGLSQQRIESIKTIKAKTRVYNIQTDKPNTFFADGIAVHNKGGGCFPAGVMINTPAGQIPIEKIKVGDLVNAITNNGKIVAVKVLETHTTKDYVINLLTASKSLRTTREHPICLYTGGFRKAGEIQSDDKMTLWSENKIIPVKVTIRPFQLSQEQEEVYNLTVDWPHTFIADGFVVHNKGGGYHGGGSHGGSGKDDFIGVIFFIGIIAFVIISSSYQSRKDENLDYVFPRSKIEKKSIKTLKLLEFLSKQDSTVSPDALRNMAQTTFLKLQECWQARSYEPMKSLMMPDIYRNHCVQLQGMVRNHEIDVIADLRIDHIDLVNIRYTLKDNQREFTALITATARDYYIDSYTHEYLRGDTKPEQFQEFWTFQYFNKVWLLREIEQTRESDVLKEDNFFEQFTDTGVKQIYGSDASKEGEPGPWLEKESQTKEVRIERMLNFLVQTDKIWNRQLMLETTRRVFLEIMAAWESGIESNIPEKDLFPEVSAHLHQSIVKNTKEGITLEFRNLCSRKVELVLVRNYTDNTKDEFVARLRAHAQKIIRRNSHIVHEDEDVTLFEQYLTFGRLDNQWKLKEILSPKAGQSTLDQENLDQDSSPQQVQWYYQHNRAT